MTNKIRNAYIAGLFDGEGCITLIWDQSSRCAGARITISQKDPSILYWLQEELGMGRVFENGKQTSQWMVTRAQDQARLIPMIYPYVRIKRKRLKLAYHLNLTKGVQGKPLPDSMRQRREELALRMGRSRAT